MTFTALGLPSAVPYPGSKSSGCGRGVKPARANRRPRRWRQVSAGSEAVGPLTDTTDRARRNQCQMCTSMCTLDEAQPSHVRGRATWFIDPPYQNRSQQMPPEPPPGSGVARCASAVPRRSTSRSRIAPRHARDGLADTACSRGAHWAKTRPHSRRSVGCSISPAGAGPIGRFCVKLRPPGVVVTPAARGRAAVGVRVHTGTAHNTERRLAASTEDGSRRVQIAGQMPPRLGYFCHLPLRA